MRSDHMASVTHINKNFEIMIDRELWNNTESLFPLDGMIWFTDGSKTAEGTGAGTNGIKTNTQETFTRKVYNSLSSRSLCNINLHNQKQKELLSQ